MPYLDPLLVCALAVPFIGFTVRKGILTLGGALLAGVIALCVVVAQGWLLLLPLFFFLISGMLLGRLNTHVRTDAKHGRPRDAMQVFCSGGLYAALAVVKDPSTHVWMYISICTATCDTWASELGMWAGRPTYNVATWKRVEPGLSGGVSGPGTVGGLIGAIVMSLFIQGVVLLSNGDGNAPDGSTSIRVMMMLALLSAAFAMGGMLLDSLLGALVQVKYNDGEGLRDAGTHQVSGLRWITNDVVNLISNALTVAVAMWLL